MKLKLNELEVIFPFQSVYKEQLEYMKAVKSAIDQKGHGILEMPSGRGKTTALLALIMAYLSTRPDHVTRLVYCTKTVIEMERTLQEAQLVLKARQAEGDKFSFKAVAMTSRRNLCIHPNITGNRDKDKVDAECNRMTAKWVREMTQGPELCPYYEGFATLSSEKLESHFQGVLSIEGLRGFGAENTLCPYYLARSMISKANIVVYNYNHLIDPQTSSMLEEECRKGSIIVFDQAHSIDEICIESYTVRLNKLVLQEAYNNVAQMESKLNEPSIQDRISAEYQTLIQQMEQAAQKESLLQGGIKAVSGQIRQASRFVKFMKRLVTGLKLKLQENSDALKNRYAVIEYPLKFAEELMQRFELQHDALNGCADRLQQLLTTMQIVEIDRFVALARVALFAKLLSSHNEGFRIVFQSNNFEDSLHEKYITMACFDSSLALKPFFSKFQTVILSSGSMSPIEMYPRLLDFKPVVSQSIEIEFSRNCIQPLIVTRTEDGTVLTSDFNERNNEDVSRSYGNFLLELSENVPDGLLVFMPSFNRMEEWVRAWEKDQILEQISKNKLLFIEGKDVKENSIKLAEYRSACDLGRGAAFFSVARGKIAEGVEFEQHYGRCVAIFGFPTLNLKDDLVLERCKVLEEKFKINRKDFIEFDAIRQSAACLGRVVKSREDYGLMIMCDERFSTKKEAKSNKLKPEFEGLSSVLMKIPKWISKNLEKTEKNDFLELSSKQAICQVRDFFRKMAQPYHEHDGAIVMQNES